MLEILQAFSLSDCFKLFSAGVFIGFAIAAMLSFLGGFIRGLFSVVMGNKNEL